MAGKKSRVRSTRPRRTNVSSQMRQMARAISHEPRRITIPQDPPSIVRTFSYNTVIACRVEVADATGFVPVPSTTLDNPLIGCAKSSDKKSVDACSLKVSDIFDAWKSWARVTPRTTGTTTVTYIDDVKLALRKVQFWGMSPNTYSGIEIGLSVDSTQPQASLSVRDAGSTNARPRCGITMPDTVWFSGVSPQQLVIVDPDAMAVIKSVVDDKVLVTGFQLGVVHLTVAVRITCLA